MRLRRHQRLVLKTSGEHCRGFRDHVIFSLALGTGLREHEILALDVGDVFGPGGKARRRIQLREVFKVWPHRAGFERIFNFHALRH